MPFFIIPIVSVGKIYVVIAAAVLEEQQYKKDNFVEANVVNDSAKFQLLSKYLQCGSNKIFAMRWQ